jgi:hypothetical protein
MFFFPIAWSVVGTQPAQIPLSGPIPIRLEEPRVLEGSSLRHPIPELKGDTP